MFLVRSRQNIEVKVQVLGYHREMEGDELQGMNRKGLGKPMSFITNANGHFQGYVNFDGTHEPPVGEDTEDEGNVPSILVGVDLNGQSPYAIHCLGRVQLIPDTGISMISDIDDTIKESDVHIGKRAAVVNAFTTSGKEVSGMADVYRYLATKGIPLHYVSAAPHNLYPSVTRFLTTHAFPPGSLHLRNLWETRQNLSTVSYKLRVIREIMEDFPNRRFILVGDSGEKDVEVYSKVFREFPGRVVKIFIRDVKGGNGNGRNVKSSSVPAPLTTANGEKASSTPRSASLPGQYPTTCTPPLSMNVMPPARTETPTEERMENGEGQDTGAADEKDAMAHGPPLSEGDKTRGEIGTTNSIPNTTSSITSTSTTTTTPSDNNLPLHAHPPLIKSSTFPVDPTHKHGTSISHSNSTTGAPLSASPAPTKLSSSASFPSSSSPSSNSSTSGSERYSGEYVDAHAKASAGFAGIDPSVWTVFEAPEKIIVDGVVAGFLRKL
ncbi:hypothetical protein HK102_005209 [Quaeritorhiza haematococci]|nr:hypothetical protein HK102_005209 [Quaeritorhiza haematococci]